MQKTGTLTRVQQSWLAARERSLMLWVAERLPAWIMPDHLTGMGVFGALLIGLGFAGSNFSSRLLWLVCLGLVLNWAGDSLDGNLARLRKIERPHYGFFIDHASDVVAQALMFLGLGASPHIRFDTACLLLLSYWIAALYTFIRAVATRVFQISYFGIGPTEIRLALLGYTLLLIVFGTLSVQTPYGRLSPLDGIAVVIFVGVCISYLTMTVSEARRLAALDSAVSAPASVSFDPPPFGLAVQDTSTS